MESIKLLPIIDGIKMEEISMGEGRLDIIYKREMVFYKSGYIMIGNKAEYHYSIRIDRNAREDEH